MYLRSSLRSQHADCRDCMPKFNSFSEDVDYTARWRHSTTLSRLDMCDTLACHPAGLGNVSSKHFFWRLIILTAASPRYAKYCYPFTPVPFNNPIPSWNWQTMLSQTNWLHSYRCKIITALLTEKKSAKWCPRSRFIHSQSYPASSSSDCSMRTALWRRLNPLVSSCWRYSQSSAWNENTTERDRQVIWAQFPLEAAKTAAGIFLGTKRMILRVRLLSVSKRLRRRGILAWRR